MSLTRRHLLGAMIASSFAPAALASASAAGELWREQYGQFTIRRTTEGLVVHTRSAGDLPPPPHTTVARHAIFVDFATKSLVYYRRLTTGAYEPVVEYMVVTPHPSTLPQDAVRGRVTRIDTTPRWCPTPRILAHPRHAHLRRKLDRNGCLPFGHPENAMGAVRFEVNWRGVLSPAVRMHGTQAYPDGRFWLEETFGCARLDNDSILALVAKLGPNAVREGVEVIFHRSWVLFDPTRVLPKGLVGGAR